MTARETADQLKQQAIDILLKEREAIEAELRALGYGKENGRTMKRRGRPPKLALDNDQREGDQTKYQPEAEPASRSI
jgi:hypothetical protein